MTTLGFNNDCCRAAAGNVVRYGKTPFTSVSRLPLPGTQRGRVARAQLNLERIQWQRQAASQRLDECFLAAPAVEEALGPSGLRQRQEVSLLGGGEVSPRQRPGIPECAPAFDIHAQFTTTAEAGERNAAAVGKVESQLRVARLAIELWLAVRAIAEAQCSGRHAQPGSQQLAQTAARDDETVARLLETKAGGARALIGGKMLVELLEPLWRGFEGKADEVTLDLWGPPGPGRLEDPAPIGRQWLEPDARRGSSATGPDFSVRPSSDL